MAEPINDAFLSALDLKLREIATIQAEWLAEQERVLTLVTEAQILIDTAKVEGQNHDATDNS